MRGAQSIAHRFGISSLVIGLTVVTFGTSAPELAISIRAGLAGQGDIALGNIVGSNILNVLLILGLSASITPLVVNSEIVQRDVPLLIGASTCLLFMAVDGAIVRIEGLYLFVGFVTYTYCLLRSNQRAKDNPDHPSEEQSRAPNSLVLMGICIVGLVLLVFGANVLVDGAVSLARHFGVTELLVGLTIVSIGTSLPEIATSLVATIRGFRDLAVGNVIGSCLLNILAVAGLSSIIVPDGLNVDAALIRFDMPIMLATAIACLPIFATGHFIDRWEGLLFLFYYCVYAVYLVFMPYNAEANWIINAAMLMFVLPLTFLTLLLPWFRQNRNE